MNTICLGYRYFSTILVTMFLIFGSDVEKKKAAKIIDPLTKRFPIREALVCPPEKANE